jgi:hypothetical protein
MDLRPRMWVSYTREAWGSPYGDGARLTFDVGLKAQTPSDSEPFVPEPELWRDVHLQNGQIIVELKFNGAFPQWMRQVVHECRMERRSVSKYVHCTVADGLSPWATLERGDQWIAF